MCEDISHDAPLSFAYEQVLLEKTVPSLFNDMPCVLVGRNAPPQKWLHVSDAFRMIIAMLKLLKSLVFRR